MLMRKSRSSPNHSSKENFCIGQYPNKWFVFGKVESKELGPNVSRGNARFEWALVGQPYLFEHQLKCRRARMVAVMESVVGGEKRAGE